MAFFRGVKLCSRLDRIKNEAIREELVYYIILYKRITIYILNRHLRQHAVGQPLPRNY